MKKFIPVILGSDENVYGLCRSFYERYNIKPYVICSKRLNATKYSKILTIKEVENFTLNEIFLETLIDTAINLKKDYEKLMLISCSEYYTTLIVNNKKELEKYYENKFLDKETLDKFIGKDKFYDLCKKYKLPYPKTIICKLKDRDKIHEKIKFDYPVVLKPNNSGSTSWLEAKIKDKEKAYILKNEKELIKTIKNINKSDYKDNLIIQEYIKGDDTSMRVINAYSSRDGIVRMISMGNVLLEEYHPNTIGNYSAIISNTEEIKLLEKVKDFLEKINYVGFSNFDFKYDEKSKNYKCFEINFRQGRSSYFTEASGISLAELITDDLIYKKKKKPIIGCPNKILWQNVPDIVLNKYVTNKNLKEEIDSLRKENKVVHTLYYKKDLNILRKLLINKKYNTDIKIYEEYFKTK